MTDPDWEPIMNGRTVIVTNRGGRTCHAAIIARELGIPAVSRHRVRPWIWPTGGRSPSPARRVTPVSSTTESWFHVESTELAEMPDIPVKIMMNVGTPDQAFAFSVAECRGRSCQLEFIINRQIGITQGSPRARPARSR